MTDAYGLPKYWELMPLVLHALDRLGGSASLAEINDDVFVSGGFSDEQQAIEYNSGNGTVLADRLSWARTYLRRAGLVDSGGRGIWIITDAGRGSLQLDGRALQRLSRAARHQRLTAVAENLDGSGSSDADEADLEPILDWRDTLLAKLRSMDPAAFERLSQRLLRESGFVKVEVTGRSGDGGIDGTGIMQLSLMSFHVLFQCKRYQGSVGSGAVRDFRGAMMGRTDKGLIITTGTFSPDARREATRDGAPPIDLIDAEALCEKLKDLSLGVETRLVEEISIKPDWFDRI
jgi:restriction system protein